MTTHKEWNALDIAAEREAIAIRKARKNMIQQHHNRSGAVRREQAIWDDGLEEHFTSCSFCGRTLKPPQEKASGGGHSITLADIDICEGCKFLSEMTYRPRSS